MPNSKWKSFTNMVDKVYPELTSVSAGKPIAIFEFGVKKILSKEIKLNG